MLEAIRRAKESLPQFRTLFASAPDWAQVKVPFVSNSGTTEHLWAELVSLGESEMQVRYMTPPVTHTGKLERLHHHPIADIEDWVIRKEPGRLVGGFTMRVMFQRGRELWGDLPPELKAEEAKYC